MAVKRGEALTLAAMWCVALKTCCSVRDARHTRPQACDSIYVQNSHGHGDRVGSWVPGAGEGNGGRLPMRTGFLSGVGEGSAMGQR